MGNAAKFQMRSEQPYIGKRVIMPMSAFKDRIPTLTQEVSKWLTERNIKPSGGSFLRYHVIDMPERMDVELGFPVDELPKIDESMTNGALPAGRYGTLIFKGIENGVSANAQLIDWIGAQGTEPDAQHTGNGDAFAGRIETVLTDPKEQPDQSKWETEIAIKTR